MGVEGLACGGSWGAVPGRGGVPDGLRHGYQPRRVLARLRERPDAAEAAGGGGADERPLPPFLL